VVDALRARCASGRADQHLHAQHFGLPYNHPPLAGWWLLLNNWVTANTAVSLPFLIGLPAILADVVAAWLIFTVLSHRRPLWEATAAGVLVGCSPVLVIISGFHGNTDSVFVMFSLLSAWLLADRGRPGWSGVCFATALSIKIIPIEILPAALIVDGPWGLVNLAWNLEHDELARWLVLHGRLIPGLVSAALAALVVVRTNRNLPASVGMAFGAFVAFSPVFATQYLAWTVAGLYLVDFFGATAFNLSAGLFLFVVYDRWSHGLPWYRAVSAGYTSPQRDVGMIAWICLLLTLAIGCVRLLSSHGQPARTRFAAERRPA
jgi:hypothetical protein